MSGATRPVMALVTGIGEYHVRVLAGMMRKLTPAGVPLLVVANEPFASQRTPSIVLDLIRRGVPRGVVAFADASMKRGQEEAAALARANLPMVTIGTKFAGVPRVVGDNVGGMRDLMRHLLDDCGVRRPVLIRGIRQQVDSQEREQVFREELAARGLAVDEHLVVNGLFRPEVAYDALRLLLRRGLEIDAVVALNDPSAFAALSALVDHGLRVPQDVLLSGFDNTERSMVSWPALTTVDQGLPEQGRVAAELILRQSANPGMGWDDDADAVIPSRLVVRASTVRGDAVLAEPVDFAETAQALQSRASLHDAALRLNWTMANCRTVDDVILGLDASLRRMGVVRCFLCLDDPEAVAAGVVGEHPTRLVLSHRNGISEQVDHESFPRHELLPLALRGELEHGILLLQALSVGGRERGFVLFEPVADSSGLTESLRIDVPRALDTVLGAQELTDRAAMLERLVAQRTQELERANAELRTSAMRDGLTGLANRMAFQQYLDDLGGPDASAGASIAVLMIDVDLFKAFNDRYGHPAGDRALKIVASCVQRAVRSEQDLACRFGGEEFAIVLREAGLDGARSVARRVRQLLSRAAVRHDASTLAPVVTVSIGVAAGRCSGPGSGAADVIDRADQALYQAKHAGRDRVVAAAVPATPATPAAPNVAAVPAAPAAPAAPNAPAVPATPAELPAPRAGGR